MDKPRFILHIEKSLNFTIFDVKWIPNSAKIAVLGCKTNGNGVLKIFELNEGELKEIAEHENQSPYKCGSFGASCLRQHFAVGDFDGKLEILDLSHHRKSMYKVQNAHKGYIMCMDGIGGVIGGGAPEILTGGKDGSVKVWDVRQNEAVINLAPAELDKSRECWAVAFGNSFDTERMICAGYDNGDLKMFDLRNLKTPRWEVNVKNGICGVEFDRPDIPMNKLVVTTLEGCVHAYDLRTQHAEKGFACVTERDAGRSLGTNGVISGAKSTVWCVKHLPQNRDIFVTCGGAGSLRLWQYNYPAQRSKEASDGARIGVAGKQNMLSAITVATQPVTCFDWNCHKIGLAVCGSLDQTVRVLINDKLKLFN